MNDPHLSFIVASYAIGFATIASLIAWTWIDHRNQSRALIALEVRTGRRRQQERR